MRAAHRALGSVDFANAARSALLVGSDPDEEKSKALCHVKSNNAAPAEPVGFVIDEEGRFRWTGQTDLSVARLLGAQASEEDHQAGTQAEDLLRETCGEEARASDVMHQAVAEGISKRTLQRAAQRLCERRREGFGKGSVVWWKLHVDPQ